MKTAELFTEIYRRLFESYGECSCPLHHETPFQLLAAVMLSAQCRDERVNKVTDILFSFAPDPERMSQMKPEQIEKIIHPCGLSGSKSKNLHACAEMIMKEFNGAVPADMDSLVSLPGIGRKSANVILGNCFDIPGFPVDTHVKRVLNRIGAVSSDSPEKIEKTVNSHTAPELWTNFSHLIIQHGRNICRASSPRCQECVLDEICKKRKLKK